MTTREELAWAAGFWDGEGSVRAKWNMKGPRRNRAIHAIVWETGHREYVHLVCWLLWPYLCSTKRAQFDNAFTRYHEMQATTRRDGG